MAQRHGLAWISYSAVCQPAEKQPTHYLTDPNMTRFMMSLEVRLILCCLRLRTVKTGIFFVKKSPATTIETLAQAIRELLQVLNQK
jgi:UDP-glucose 4-epimerase